MPAPLACCARSSSSAGNSTVIFRAPAIIYIFTILNTSIQYGIGGGFPLPCLCNSFVAGPAGDVAAADFLSGFSMLARFD
jgi:hypothetical protein